jgi:hypothetical protein
MRAPVATPLLALALWLAAPTIAAAAILISVDRSTQRMIVSVDGAQRWVWPVSTGRNGYATPAGSYTAFRMEEDHYSKEFDDAPMPHSIFFTKEGHAIHGTLDARHLGSAASHGCVRLSTANAAKLYALVEQQGLPNTMVVITGKTPAGARRRVAADADGDTPTTYGMQPRYAPRGAAYQQPSPPPSYPSYPQYQPVFRGFPLFGGN